MAWHIRSTLGLCFWLRIFRIASRNQASHVSADSGSSMACQGRPSADESGGGDTGGDVHVPGQIIYTRLTMPERLRVNFYSQPLRLNHILRLSLPFARFFYKLMLFHISIRQGRATLLMLTLKTKIYQSNRQSFSFSSLSISLSFLFSTCYSQYILQCY